MSYSIIRLERVADPSVTTAMQRHNQRENKNYQNKNINHEMTSHNIDLIHGNNKVNYNDLINNIIEQKYDARNKDGSLRKIRKNTVKHVQGIITSDEEFFYSLNSHDKRKFFEESLDFLKEKYGEDNLLYATVHYDEKTPHMHFGFVPLTEDGRLSAKEIIGNRSKMSHLQDEFNSHINHSGFNLDRGISKSEDHDVHHISPEQYKKQTSFYRNEKNKAKLEKKRLEEEIEALEITYKKRKREVEDIEAIISEEKAQKIAEIEDDLRSKRNEIALLNEEVTELRTERKRLEPQSHSSMYWNPEFENHKDFLGRDTGKVIISQEDFLTLKEKYQLSIKLTEENRHLIRQDYPENHKSFSNKLNKENGLLRDKIKQYEENDFEGKLEKEKKNTYKVKLEITDLYLDFVKNNDEKTIQSFILNSQKKSSTPNIRKFLSQLYLNDRERDKELQQEYLAQERRINYLNRGFEMGD